MNVDRLSAIFSTIMGQARFKDIVFILRDDGGGPSDKLVTSEVRYFSDTVEFILVPLRIDEEVKEEDSEDLAGSDGPDVSSDLNRGGEFDLPDPSIAQGKSRGYDPGI